MRVGVRQQREEARALDRRVELALVVRLRAGQAGRRDLAVLADEVAQRLDVLVVDLVDFLRGEAAEALALEQRILLVAATRLALPLALASCSKCHFRLPRFLSLLRIR